MFSDCRGLEVDYGSYLNIVLELIILLAMSMALEITDKPALAEPLYIDERIICQ